MAAHNGGPADPWTAAAREKFARYVGRPLRAIQYLASAALGR